MLYRFFFIFILNAAFALPAYSQVNTETSLEFGGFYEDNIDVSENGTDIRLKDVKGIQAGIHSERKLSELGESDVMLALSLVGGAGEGSVSNITESSEALLGDQVDYQTVEGFADLIIRKETKSFSPFVSAGAGLRYERIDTGNSNFENLSPAGRFRAGLEKDVSKNFTLGVSSGPSVEFD